MKECGIILFSTCCLLFLLALLILSQSQLFLMQFKAVNQVFAKEALLEELEDVANLLIKRSNWSSSCFKKTISAENMMKLLQEDQGCHFTQGEQTYLFAVEDLGLYPCLQARLQSTTYSTTHFRFSIMNMTKKIIFLQLRVAYPSTYEVCQHSDVKQVPLGVISWLSF